MKDLTWEEKTRISGEVVAILAKNNLTITESREILRWAEGMACETKVREYVPEQEN